MSDLIRVTGLWKSTSKDGKTHLSGTVGGVKVLIFPNDRKQTDAQPDYTLMISKKEEQPQRSLSDAEVDRGRAFTN